MEQSRTNREYVSDDEIVEFTSNRWTTIMHTTVRDKGNNNVRWIREFEETTAECMLVGMCDCVKNKTCTNHEATAITAIKYQKGIYEWRVSCDFNKEKIIEPLVFYVGKGDLRTRILHERLGYVHPIRDVVFKEVYTCANQLAKRYKNAKLLIEFAFEVRFQYVADEELIKKASLEKTPVGVTAKEHYIIAKECAEKAIQLVTEGLSLAAGTKEKIQTRQQTKTMKKVKELATQARIQANEAEAHALKVNTKRDETLKKKIDEIEDLFATEAESHVLDKYDYIANTSKNGERRRQSVINWLQDIQKRIHDKMSFSAENEVNLRASVLELLRSTLQSLESKSSTFTPKSEIKLLKDNLDKIVAESA